MNVFTVIFSGEMWVPPRYRDLRFSVPLESHSSKSALAVLLNADSGAAIYTDDVGRVVGIRCGPEHSPDVADIAGAESSNPQFDRYRPDIG